MGWWSSILLAVIDVNVVEELACRNSLCRANGQFVGKVGSK
jgi:hypothetical protein